jgi:hypothetical protein
MQVPTWRDNEKRPKLLELEIPLQPPGSNSCGLVALATFLAMVDSDFPIWTPKDAERFRTCMLERLVSPKSANLNMQLRSQPNHFIYHGANYHLPIAGIPSVEVPAYPTSWKANLLNQDDTVVSSVHAVLFRSLRFFAVLCGSFRFFSVLY